MRLVRVLVALLLCLVLSGPGRAEAGPFLADTDRTNKLCVCTCKGVVQLTTCQGAFHSARGENEGWWSTDHCNMNSDGNYIVGNCGPFCFNDFFTFDAASLAGDKINGATLQVEFDGSPCLACVTYRIGSVSVCAACLNCLCTTPGSARALTNFAALEDGTKYGCLRVNTGSVDGFESIILNSAGAAALQSAVTDEQTYFSIGGTLSTAPASGGAPEVQPSAAALPVAAILATLAILLERRPKRTV